MFRSALFSRKKHWKINDPRWVQIEHRRHSIQLTAITNSLHHQTDNPLNDNGTICIAYTPNFPQTPPKPTTDIRGQPSRASQPIFQSTPDRFTAKNPAGNSKLGVGLWRRRPPNWIINRMGATRRRLRPLRPHPTGVLCPSGWRLTADCYCQLEPSTVDWTRYTRVRWTESIAVCFCEFSGSENVFAKIF